jgi:hypothetical protein
MQKEEGRRREPAEEPGATILLPHIGETPLCCLQSTAACFLAIDVSSHPGETHIAQSSSVMTQSMFLQHRVECVSAASTFDSSGRDIAAKWVHSKSTDKSKRESNDLLLVACAS